MAKKKSDESIINVDLTGGGTSTDPKAEEKTEFIIPEEVKPEEQAKAKSSRRRGKTNVEDAKIIDEKKSETVNVDELKDSAKNEPVVIDFMNSDESQEFIGRKTKKSSEEGLKSDEKTDTEEKSEFEGKSTQEIRDQILKEEQEKTNNFKPSDYEEIAKMVVGIIDLLFSSLLKWWAKDTSDEAYSLNKKKKDAIAYQMTLIMIKHQKKWSIEFMFVISLIAVYTAPAMAAHAHRKKVLKQEESAKRTKGNPRKH